MKRASIIWLGIGACVAMIVLARQYAIADTADSKTQEIEKFGDGFVLINTQRTAGLEVKERMELIRDARLIKMGERYFIRGKGVLFASNRNDAKYKWYEGVDVAIDWQSVLTPDA
jgi:hypothetical protein